MVVVLSSSHSSACDVSSGGRGLGRAVALVAVVVVLALILNSLLLWWLRLLLFVLLFTFCSFLHFHSFTFILLIAGELAAVLTFVS